jgi:hypothetical protein
MLTDDHDGAARPAPRLPPELVHRVRNGLTVAIATADLLLLDRSLGLPAVRDLQKIRRACIEAMAAVNKAA